MPLKKWIDSANNAIEGILTAARNERHVRYHLYAATAVLLFSYASGVTTTEFLIVSILTILVITTELLNTAIETVVDISSPQISEQARIAKDVAAGAVLISAVGSAIVGYIILFPYLVKFFKRGLSITAHGGNEIAVLSLIIVSILVILVKSLTSGKGHPLRGGMPSGHAALSFSVWVSITVITQNLVVSTLSFLGATAIAASRVESKIHTVAEVIIGALLGSIATYLLFIVFT
ncbi:diacylglycerol kinase [Candidatus Magnetominusculus dajiuhuensis]|uniref:diacylglycerol kinase n=1 Tax=Candidatus Magnetominusculus dajiuhuensis TaxID=3137712 RepID=UPI003B43B3B1